MALIPADFNTDSPSSSPAGFPTRIGSTYDWDFAAMDFVVDGDDEPVVIEGHDSLVQQLEKLLKTRRYTYLAYSHNFGSSVHDMVLNAIAAGNSDIIEYLAEMAVRESLLSDHRVARVDWLIVTVSVGTVVSNGVLFSGTGALTESATDIPAVTVTFSGSGDLTPITGTAYVRIESTITDTFSNAHTFSVTLTI